MEMVSSVFYTNCIAHINFYVCVCVGGGLMSIAIGWCTSYTLQTGTVTRVIIISRCHTHSPTTPKVTRHTDKVITGSTFPVNYFSISQMEQWFRDDFRSELAKCIGRLGQILGSADAYVL